MPRSLPLLLVLLVTLVTPLLPTARGVTAETRSDSATGDSVAGDSPAGDSPVGVSAAEDGAAGDSAAGEPVRLAIGQGVWAAPHLTLFVDLVDASGIPPASVASSRVTATIGASRAEVIRITPFAATGEAIAYIFVVDVSRSVSAGDMTRVRAALTRWAAQADPRDRLALITFGDGVATRVDFTADRAAFAAAVARLRASDRTTRLHGALERAIELGRRADADLPARRAAIVLSDGKDEGSGLTQDDVAALLRQDRLPIYAIGYSRLSGRDRASGFDALRRLAANSGGEFQDASRTPLDDVYPAMQRAIARVFAITLKCEACPADGRLHPLDLRITAGSRVLSAGTDVRLPAPLNGGARESAAKRGSGGQAQGGDASTTAGAEAGATPERSEHARGGGHGLMHGSLEVLVAALLLVLLLLSLAAWWLLRRRRHRRLSRAASGANAAAGGTNASASSEDGSGTAALDDAGDPGAAGIRASSSSSSIGSDGVAITCHFRGHAAPPPAIISLRDRALIGSDPSCDLVIADDDEVAAVHGELMWRDGRVMLRRLAEQTTLVNGGAIGMGGTTAYPLESGDLLRLGRSEMRVIIAPLETLHAPSRVDPTTVSRADVPRRREVTR